ncbi:vomeronasal type-2 receptor 26-like [Protopterus annectens]|uniref:vomeronasal type-2 receptor 26-like n=1 Tax=Protopterus annectens TaxID=7888 RepID=UPI001CFA8B38|nr:vomeronasal type-2 receptor 26-like [Protopterus annectens]
MVWHGDREELSEFVTYLNDNSFGIKFTANIERENIVFLDVLVTRLSDNTLATSVHRKFPEYNTLLHAESCHPRHIIRNIPKSQFMRIKRICSSEQEYSNFSVDLSRRFINRGYKAHNISTTMDVTNRLTRTELLEYKSHNLATSAQQRNQPLRFIEWENSNVTRTVPISVCTESCSPGYRKTYQHGQLKCCFICIPCSDGEISNKTDSVECLRCPDDHMSNERRDMCLQKSVEFLAYEDPLGAALATLAILFALMPTAILIIFSLYKETPIVRANNREISYFLFVALVMCCLCSLIFIGRPNRVTCLIQQTTFGVVFAFCVSCVLAKTIMVVIAFKATNPKSSLRKWVGPALPITIIFCCTLSQIILCMVWLLISPPFPEVNMKYLSTKIVIQCNDGSTFAFWCMLGYMSLLSCASFVIAFLARKLPDSFNEAQFITFSMLVFVSVWISFIPAYLSTKGKYMVAVEIFAILSSSAGLLSCIFLPKCYIILLRPDMNTKEYLMGKGAHNHKKTNIVGV